MYGFVGLPSLPTGDAAAWPIQGLIRHFRHEIEDRITDRRRRARPAVAAE
jgi:NADH-quinone oxidoreductase subunit F